MTASLTSSPGSAPAGRHLVVLDGVRGLAIAMVLCVHFVGDAVAHTRIERAAVKVANYGIWGVDLFFVLSGFLITGLLYDSKKSPHYFRDFYVRRTLRIFPLYYGVLTLLLVIGPHLPISYPAGLAESARHQAWLWLYASNVYLAIHRTWALPYVGHFWSLAVEEQFYLVWPVVVLSCGRRSLLGVCVGVTALALLLRCVLSFAGAGPIAELVLTPCRFDALCIGGFLAIVVRSTGLARVARMAGMWLGPLLCLLLLTSLWNALRGTLSNVVLPIRGTLIALNFGALLVTSLAATSGSLLGRLFRNRTLCFLGTRSYGLYVFHGIVAYAMQGHVAALNALATRIGSGPAMVVEAVGGAGVSIVIATISYDLFEKPFLRLKTRFAPSNESARPAPILDARPSG